MEIGGPFSSSPLAVLPAWNFKSFYDSAFEKAPVGMALVLANGTLVEVNARFGETLGGCATEMVGTNLFNYFHPEDRSSLLSSAEQLKVGARVEIASELRQANRWVSLRITSCGAAPGDSPWVAIVGDITEKKKREAELVENEAEFRALFELVAAGIVQFDPPDGKIVVVNSKFCEITGYSRDELVQMTLSDLTHPADRELSLLRFRAILDGAGEYHFEKRYVRKDGESVWVQVAAKRFPGRIPGTFRTVSVVQDITARKRAEDGVRGAERQLRRMAEDLRRSNRDLEQFAYAASHDLKEPLRMVSSYLRLLQKRYGEKIDQDADEFINFAVDGAGRMSRLIEDLLSYARVGSRGKVVQRVDCECVLRAALNNLSCTIVEQGAEISHDRLPTVQGDASQLVLLFQNLISNALKFQRPETPPKISIAVRESPNEYIFTVRDNGIGIEPQYWDKIFIIFKRLHSRETYVGTGIGLATCKRIVEMHGGRIWLSSEPNQGTVFYFSIPR